MKKTKKRKLTLLGRQQIEGYLFISPFIFGFLVLFLVPLGQSLIYSFSTLKVVPGGFTLEPAGWANYYKAILIDPEYVRILVESIMKMFADVPIVLIFSFFVATMLNQKFKGRGLARMIFFLPVILTSGIIVGFDNNQGIQQMMQEGSAETAAMVSTAVTDVFMQLKMDPKFITYVMNGVEHIYDVVISSGVQILIFLAALQTIPVSVYESASIEGATGWECFWKITFPMISPLILVNVVYTIINAFTSANNSVMNKIRQITNFNIDYGLGSAMSWIYFLVISIFLALVTFIISKKVYYYE